MDNLFHILPKARLKIGKTNDSIKGTHHLYVVDSILEPKPSNCYYVFPKKPGSN